MSRTLSFEEATAVVPESSHTYSVNFANEWCIGSVPHGGYVTSCFMRVARTHFNTTLARQNQPHTITLHLEFMRRTEAGPALFTVHDAKLGRQTSTIHITLAQGDRTEVVGYLTNSNMDTADGITIDTEWKPQPSPSPANPRLFDSDSDPNWKEKTNMPHREFRKAANKVKWVLPRKIQDTKAVADAWMSLRTTKSNGVKEKFTDISLGYLSDMWPQIIEKNMDSSIYDPLAKPQGKDGSGPSAKFWYPTLLLNLEMKKALPVEGVDWLFVRVLSKKIHRGRYDLDVTMLDEEGDVVAVSHHVAFALPASRNLASRKKQQKL